MKLTLLNPHADDFIAGPVSFKLARRRALKKYSYLISEQINHHKTVDILIDGTLSSLFPQDVFAKFPATLRKAILNWEINTWLKLNDLEGKVNIHWSPDTVADKSVLYLFAYKNCTGVFAKRHPVIEAFDLKIINLSHFMIRTGEKGQNAQKLKNVVYTSEADLSETPFFQKFFGLNQRIIALPFMVGERFQNLVPFDQRKDKCGATGSFHALQYERPRAYYADFMDFFKVDTYHPIRKTLYAHRDTLGDVLESRISPYREKKLGIFSRLDISQQKYFSFDIVEFYNQHQYALVGEEIHGLAAIGSFEAMACGCTLLGEKGPYYKGLGLEPGEHFVEHDGSLDSIRAAIQTLRDNPEDAQKMSRRAHKYTQENCKSAALWRKLTERITEYQAKEQ